MSLLIATRRLRPGEIVLALLWFAIVIPLAFLASIPTSNAVQGALGLFAVLGVAVLKPFTMKSIAWRVSRCWRWPLPS